MILMENELMLKRGQVNFDKFYTSEDRERKGLASFRYILDDIKDLKERYIKLGFHLAEFRLGEYYKTFGFSTFKEFCEENMPIGYSTCSRCIQVFEVFSEKHKMFIAEKYENFSFSQLVEMVSIDSRRREIIKPDWSVEKIRRYKKGLKKQDNEKNVPVRDENEPSQEEIFSQVLSSDNAMKLLLDALKKKFGNDCMDSFRLTASSIVFNCGGEKYRLQLNKVK